MKKYIYLILVAILATAGFHTHKSRELEKTKFAAESHAKAASQLLEKQWGTNATDEGDVEEKIQRQTEAGIKAMRELEGLHNKEIIYSTIAYLEGIQSSSSSSKNYVSYGKEYLTELVLMSGFVQMAAITTTSANKRDLISTFESKINSIKDSGNKFKKVCTTMQRDSNSLRDAKDTLTKHVANESLISNATIDKISKTASEGIEKTNEQSIKFKAMLTLIQPYK